MPYCIGFAGRWACGTEFYQNAGRRQRLYLPGLPHCGAAPDAAAWAVQLSRRHFSVGADGVIYLCPPLRADGDAAMRMFNADGSEGVMCGNGVRCAAEFLYTHGVRRDCIPHRHALSRAAGAAPGRGRAVAGRDGPLYGSTGRRGGRGAGRRTAAGCAALRRRARVAGALCSRGQPALRTLYARAAARRGGAGRLGPCAGAPPGVPRGHQRGICPAHQPHRAGCDGVGARQRATLACGTGACAVAAAAVLTGRCPRGAPF